MAADILRQRVRGRQVDAQLPALINTNPVRTPFHIHDNRSMPVWKHPVPLKLPPRVDKDVPVDLSWKKNRPDGTEIFKPAQEVIEKIMLRKIAATPRGTHERKYLERDYDNWKANDMPVAGYAPRNTRGVPW